MKTAVGIDFGTLSARALLIDVETGEELASGVYEYPNGVITERLPCGTPIPQDFALQNPHDYLTALQHSIAEMFDNTTCPPQSVVAIGIDFTASTVVASLADGTPLCFLDKHRGNPHAWCKLWKHHGATEQAERMTELAVLRGEPWLNYYGGRVSGEFMLPKLLETLEKAPEVYSDADCFVDAGDWLVWQLCGKLVRSACTIGFKCFYDSLCGFPSREYFAALNPGFADVITTKLTGPIKAVGSIGGYLTDQWSERLGINPATPVSVASIDAHASAPGSGICEPGKLLMIIGTSTCHIVLDKEKRQVKGVNGVVDGGIINGLYAYEAGQCCVGDSFSWYLDNCLPHRYVLEASERNLSLHAYLREKAALLRPGQSGLIALDWFNGVRSPLMDFDLSSAIIGLKLSTKPEEIYRAIIEATAFGARKIVECFTESGIAVDEIYAAGGIAHKDSMAMQIYADILGRPVRIAGGHYSGARGSAIYAIHAAGMRQSSLCETVRILGDIGTDIFLPIPAHVSSYNRLYGIYNTVYTYLGCERRDILQALHELQAP